MSASKIEWTGKTWNPIVGCSVVSPGCTNCYAMRMAARLKRMGVRGYEGLTRPSKAGAVWTGKMRLVEDALAIPLKRRTPTTYFVNSMSDLFHESVPDEWIDRVFAVMALAPQHTFQILTKRPASMRAYVGDAACEGRVGQTVYDAAPVGRDIRSSTLTWTPHRGKGSFDFNGRWPLPNIWLGVSAEDQQRADERVPDLLATPAAVRFVSAEPLLGPIDFTSVAYKDGQIDALRGDLWGGSGTGAFAKGLDWIIVGGESGHGARPMHPEWEREIREACVLAGVAYFRKQWGAWRAAATNDGEWPVDAPGFIRLRSDGSRGSDGWPMQRVGKKAAGHLLDGVKHRALPEVRQ